MTWRGHFADPTAPYDTSGPESFGTCAHCDSPVYERGATICQSCQDEGWRQCPVCGEWFDDLAEFPEDADRCATCQLGLRRNPDRRRSLQRRRFGRLPDLRGLPKREGVVRGVMVPKSHPSNEPEPCTNCGRLTLHTYGGLCESCAEDEHDRRMATLEDRADAWRKYGERI
jgi:hypothetical protein